jgi:hypothetical protein
MKKKLLAIGLGVALSATTVSVFAAHSLTLKNSTVPDTINVICNGKEGKPIGPGKSLRLPYSFVVGFFGSNTLECTFSTKTGDTIGIAELHINPSNTLAQVVSATTSPGYSATVTSTVINSSGTHIHTRITPITTSTVPADDMSVALND